MNTNIPNRFYFEQKQKTKQKTKSKHPNTPQIFFKNKTTNRPVKKSYK